MSSDKKLHPLDDVAEEILEKRYRLAMKQGYFDLFKNVLVMILFLVIVFHFVFFITTAVGTDMYPAVLDGDIVIGYRLDQTYLKNDVVVCDVAGREVIGRVVAKEGDYVDISEDGVLYVNGTVQTGEIAFPTMPGKQNYPYIVPEGCIYLLGDYRTNTKDSRDFGPVKKKDVKAKVICIFRRRGI